MSTSSAPIRPRSLRAGRAVLLSMAAILVALVAVVWILPGMLDWNRYRSSIASLVAAGIGRPVQIDGNITLHLLPQPFLTATDLKVDDTGDGILLQVKAVRLRVALGPLIAGRVDARELTLQGADLRLPWPPPPGALSRRPPAWITGLQARVEESRLQIGDFVLSGIHAALGADPDTGTLSAAGTATVFDRPFRFTTRFGRPGRDGAAPIDFSLDGLAKLRDTGGTVSGTVEADGSLSGRVTARGPDLSQLLPAPAVAWRGDGRISAAGGVVVADELAVELAGSPARGAVALRVQPDVRLDVAIAASRLDLDTWTPVLLRAAQPGHPPGIPTGIDLSTESAMLAGGTLRQVRAAFDMDPDGVVIREASAILPGDAKLSVRGRFPNRGKVAAFEGIGQLIAPDLRTTLHWLEPAAPAVIQALPQAAFRTANITAKLALDPAQLSLTDLKGTLDGAAAQGGLAIRLAARLGLSGGLTLDRLLLDPWLPEPAVFDHPAAAYAGAVKALATAGFDTDLKLQVREADWRGARFGPLAADVQSEAGRLTVRRLEVTMDGFHAAVSGTLGDGGRVTEGRIDLGATDAAPIRSFLPSSLTDLAPLAKGPANLLVSLAGPPEALAVRATLDLGDLRAELQPVFNVPARRFAGPVTVHHPGAPRLLAQLGYAGTASWLGDGSFSLIAHLAAVPGQLDLNGLDLVAGAMRLTGQASLAQHRLQGRLRAETLTVPAIDPRSPDPLPLLTLGDGAVSLHVEAERMLVGLAPTVTDLATDVVANRDGLALEGLSAKLAGGTIALSAKVEPGDLPHLSLTARLNNIVLPDPVLGAPLDLTAGTLAATASLTAEGFSPAALAATLGGTGKLTVENAAVTGFDLAAARAALVETTPSTAALRSAVLSGTTVFPFLELSLGAKRGVVTVEAQGAVPPGSATLTGTLDALSRTFEGRLDLLPAPDLPVLPVRLSGPLANPARTPELAGASRWLAERP
ncbi:MAG: AsmA family protein [Acetobacteraceae bacterium]|nr:AsmA family protein [Acetobacteraceae bacterium]